MITELSTTEVIAYCRSFLGIETESTELDDVLLAELLRRSAGILCPCSRVALRAAVVECMSYLHPDTNALAAQLEDLIQDMIVTGDLLELFDVATDDPEVKGTWVFSAPPSYVVRRNGSIFLIGISSDQDSFLPEDLNGRVVYSHVTRYIVPNSDENLAERLSEHGLNHHPDDVWLKSPKEQAPAELIERYQKQLSAKLACGEIAGLEILNGAAKVTYYRGRWGPPLRQSGTFIARRPQEYGAPLWSFVELLEGVPQRILDLPLKNFRWRGCDAAWQLQLAIDYCEGRPQRYRRRVTTNNACFNFFSPLPLWAQRRLMIIGRELPPEKSLCAYEIPIAEAEQEEKNLQQNLWLQEINA